jgi:hypothetical protein
MLLDKKGIERADAGAVQKLHRLQAHACGDSHGREIAGEGEVPLGVNLAPMSADIPIIREIIHRDVNAAANIRWALLHWFILGRKPAFNNSPGSRNERLSAAQRLSWAAVTAGDKESWLAARGEG